MGTRFAFNFSERTESSLFGFLCSLLLNHLYFTFFLDALAALYLTLAQKCLVMGNFQSVPRNRKGTDQKPPPRCSSGANAGGRAFCHELDIGWVHIVQWIFSILAISDALFWRKGVFCVFTLYNQSLERGILAQNTPKSDFRGSKIPPRGASST